MSDTAETAAGSTTESDSVPDTAELGYEQARDQLIQVVQELEAGGLSLDQSLRLWERGEQLANVCERHLAGARERVEAALSSVEDSATAEQDDTSGD